MMLVRGVLLCTLVKAMRSAFTGCVFVLCAAHCSADDSERDHGTSAGGNDANGGSSGSGGTGLGASAGTGAEAGAGASGGQAGVSPADATSDSASDTSTSDAGDAADAADAADATSGPGSAGCENGAGLSDGEITFESGGLERSFLLHKPAAYTRDRRWPVVLALHPNGSNSGYWNRSSGDLAIRPLVQNQAVLVLADAGDGDWREDLPGDLQYFDQIMTRVERELCIDTQRIFAMGFSGGGSFSGVLGCHRTDIRAIASGGAVIYFDPEACVGNPAAWVTIGDGELIPERAMFRDFWRMRNECATASTPVEPAPCIAYQCPHPNRPMHFCAHPGGHVWPDFGAQAAWQFFSQF